MVVLESVQRNDERWTNYYCHARDPPQMRRNAALNSELQLGALLDRMKQGGLQSFLFSASVQ